MRRCNIKEAIYEDAAGRSWTVLLPDGVPEGDASMGLPLGPPSLAALELPLETEVRLHNQLNARSIFTYAQARERRQEVFAALQAAFRVDTETIVQLYNPDAIAKNAIINAAVAAQENGSGPIQEVKRRGRSST